MFRCLRFAIILLLSIAVGCGGPAADPKEVFHPEQLQGTVDTSLPSHLQAKQEALAEVLVLLREGVDFDTLPEYTSGVQFDESLEDFLEGTIDLAGWDFNGKPTGDDVPVVLYLSEDSSGRNERRVQRVYTVTGSPGRITIRRKAPK